MWKQVYVGSIHRNLQHQMDEEDKAELQLIDAEKILPVVNERNYNC